MMPGEPGPIGNRRGEDNLGAKAVFRLTHSVELELCWLVSLRARTSSMPSEGLPALQHTHMGSCGSTVTTHDTSQLVRDTTPGEPATPGETGAGCPRAMHDPPVMRGFMTPPAVSPGVASHAIGENFSNLHHKVCVHCFCKRVTPDTGHRCISERTAQMKPPAYYSIRGRAAQLVGAISPCSLRDCLRIGGAKPQTDSRPLAAKLPAV